MSITQLRRRLSDGVLGGPPVALPGALDRMAEWWAGVGPRGRLAVAAASVCCGFLALSAWASSVEQRWGGAPVTVLVAGQDLAPGDEPRGLLPVRVPPAIAPPDALATTPTGRLAFALPSGTVLTSRHLDARGPGAGLDDGRRAVPVPVEDGWAVEAGGWVDVWVLGAGEAPARLVGRACSVLEVRDGDRGRTALVAVPAERVGDVTEGLALGRVLLAHSPPP